MYMKAILNLRVDRNIPVGEGCGALILAAENGMTLPEVKPGQFVNVEIPGVKDVFLRRPISICDVSDGGRKWTLMIRNAGKGTNRLLQLETGATLNIVGPLGNGFPMENVSGRKHLLIGGGVGVAPLLYYGKRLVAEGAEVVFLLGARSVAHLYMPGAFNEVAPTCIATEDGSAGIKGFVTDNVVMNSDSFDSWSVCGPAPMMKAVAAMAKKRGVDCNVSLENMMACGLGACLCCVEKTVRGNVCVCTNGPVFNLNELTW